MRRRLHYWRQYLLDKTRKRYRRRVLLFLVCVVLAFAFWILNILNQTYVYELEATLAFTHVPPDRALVLDQSNKLSITVQGTGWNFIRSRLHLLHDTLKIDLRKYAQSDHVDLLSNSIPFESQWNGRLKIVQLFPSKIMLNVTQKHVRKLPVRVNLKMNFAPTYDLVGAIVCSPDSLFVSGSEKELNALKYIETELFSTSELTKSASFWLSIKPEKYRNIMLSASAVKISVPVEQFTEQQIQLPIASQATLPGYFLTTIPATCMVKFKVPLSKFNSINATAFRVMAEPSVRLNNQFALKIKKAPLFVKDLKLEPELVDYLWMKK